MNLTTGQSSEADDDYLKNYMNDVMVMLGVFTQDAIRLASMYCSHSGRTSVTSRDVELALKTRAFHSDDFWNRNGIQQTLVEMKKFLYQAEAESDHDSDSDSEMEVDDQTDQDEHFTISECTCEICSVLNGIEAKWDTWSPTDRNNMTIKKSVDDTFCKQEMETDSDSEDL